MGSESVERGRAAFAQRAWREAFDQLSTADCDVALEPQDLEQLAIAAHLIGQESDSAEIWARAYKEFVSRGNLSQAARCAFWLAFFALIMQGDVVLSSGWIARGNRLLDEGQLECAEQGYLLVPDALLAVYEGDASVGYADFSRVAELGDRYGDQDLIAFGRLGQGEALIRLGQVAEGTRLLDEIMVAVAADELSPLAVGIVYCAVLEACHEIFDVRRSKMWVAAFSRWCEPQPDLIPYRGQCLVHRAEVLQLRGEWPDALLEAELAGKRYLEGGGRLWVGPACYQQGELHRLRGDYVKAEEAYREASSWGYEPEPGLALLRLTQGRLEASAAAIHRALIEVESRIPRAKLLAAHVEIMLETGDLVAARASSHELSSIAEEFNMPLLRALAVRAQGAVLLSEGDAGTALPRLRRALTILQDLEAPYEAARARVLIGLACQMFGDDESAAMELDSAASGFRQLGAEPDLVRIESLAKNKTRDARGLTPRQIEVLRLVASGKTNREIAEILSVSDHTVRRHLQNIFGKIDVSSRAAATAFAYRHDLV